MFRLSLIGMSSVLFLTPFLVGCDTASEPVTQSESGTPAAQVPVATGEDVPPPLPGQIVRALAGTQLPDLTFADPAGNTISTADLRGTPVLLNLWATWCVPCRKEMPLLDNLADQLGDDVKVLTVSQDDADKTDKVVEFFEEGGFRNLEQWLDPEADLGVRFAQGGLLPTTILFDGEGKELFRVAGDYAWDSEDAIAAVREAIAESASADSDSAE